MMVIRAHPDHLLPMAQLSYIKRRAYEKEQPQFWRYAGANGDQAQIKWFEDIISSPEYIALVVAHNNSIEGFVIGKIVPAPEVYDPGGLTLVIDDFCVTDNQWEVTGQFLLDEIRSEASTQNIAQIVIVSGAHDASKKQLLEKNNLDVASEWYVGAI